MLSMSSWGIMVPCGRVKVIFAPLIRIYAWLLRSTAGKVAMQTMNDTHMGDAQVPLEVFKDERFYENIMFKMNEMRERKSMTDLSLYVEGFEYPAHSALLAAGSDYFLAMCESNLIPQDGKVEIRGISQGTFQQLLNYLYTGKITITEDNVEEILRGSAMFLLEKVRDKCCSYLHSLMNIYNCLGIWRISEELSCPELSKKAISFVQDHLHDVIDTEEFYELPLEWLYNITEADSLWVINEDIVFEAINKWTSYDISQRMKVFPKLLKTVRLPFVSEDYLKNQLLANEFILQSESCRAIMADASSHRTAIRQSLSSDVTDYERLPLYLRPRQCVRDVEVIVAVGGVNALFYNAETDLWLSFAPITTRHCPGMAVMDNRLFVVGGSREWKRLATGITYDPKLAEWDTTNRMERQRSNLDLVALDGYLYAVGGYDGVQPVRCVERFSPAENKWERRADMNFCRDGGCIVADQSNIFAITGYDGDRYLSSMEIYNPEKDEWVTEGYQPITCYRENASSAYLNGKIYIFGGYFDNTFLSECNVYDIDSNSWDSLPPMSIARYQSGASVLKRCIFVCGGWTGEGMASALVECFDVDQNCWHSVSSLPTPCTIRCATLKFPRKKIDELASNQDKVRRQKPRTESC